MKNILTVLSLIIIFSSFAQKDITEEKFEKKTALKNIFLMKKNTISVSPTSLLGQRLELTYERKFGKNHSLMFLGSFYQFGDLKTIGNIETTFELHYRNYLYYTKIHTKKYPKSENTFGFFASPFVGYLYGESSYYTQNYYNYPSTRKKGSIQTLQFGVLLGVNVNILKGRMSLGSSFGFSENIKIYQDSYQIRVPNVLANANVFGIIPRLNFNIGVNF